MAGAHEPVNAGGMFSIRGLYDKLAKAPNSAEELRTTVERLSGVADKDSIVQDLGSYTDFAVASVPKTTASAMAGFLAGDPGEDEFYHMVWELVSSDAAFPTTDMKTVALGAVLADPRMPYRQHQLLTLGEADYATKLAALEPDIEEMKRVVFRRFSQKTEEASALLEIIESHSERDDRVVLLGYLLAAVRPPEPNYNV